MRRALDQGCGILRDGEHLAETVAALHSVRDELLSEGRLKSFVGRSVIVALCIAQPALARAESRGDHFRTDHPGRDDVQWLGNLILGYDAQAGIIDSRYEQAGIATRTSAPLSAR